MFVKVGKQEIVEGVRGDVAQVWYSDGTTKRFITHLHAALITSCMYLSELWEADRVLFRGVPLLRCNNETMQLYKDLSQSYSSFK